MVGWFRVDRSFRFSPGYLVFSRISARRVELCERDEQCGYRFVVEKYASGKCFFSLLVSSFSSVVQAASRIAASHRCEYFRDISRRTRSKYVMRHFDDQCCMYSHASIPGMHNSSRRFPSLFRAVSFSSTSSSSFLTPSRVYFHFVFPRGRSKSIVLEYVGISWESWYVVEKGPNATMQEI